MSSQILLSGGDKWYSYSGEVIGVVSVPASIQLILIENTGLKDSLIRVQPFVGIPISTGANQALGLTVKLDDVVIYNQQFYNHSTIGLEVEDLFIPRQSKLEILSNNTSGNNTAVRGCNVIGYYL